MNKFEQDELHLIVDFLEEQLDITLEKGYWATNEEQEELRSNEFMFERTLEIIKSLIKE